MVIPPLILNPYYWVDDHPLLYRNNASLDPSTYMNYFPRQMNRYEWNNTVHAFRNESTWPGIT